MSAVLLLELEGVIVHTLPLRARALEEALAGDGIAVTTDQAVELCRGRSVRRAVAAAALAGKVSYDLVMLDVVAAQAERAFASAAAVRGVTLAAGAAAFVHTAQLTARCAIVTRASRAEADQLLRLTELSDAFECIVSLEDVAEEKPAPASYRAAITRLERKRPVAAHSVVALEDGGDGARAARAAGIVCMVVGPAPASEALEADGYLPGLEYATMESIQTIAARAREHTP